MMRKIPGLTILCVCLAVTSLFADDYKVRQITDNAYSDAGIEIYGSRLAWQTRLREMPATQIFFYDGEKVIQLTDSDTYKCTPSISSGGIVWQEYRKDGGTKVFFRISKGRKTWYEYPVHAPSDIFFYDLKDIRCLTEGIKGDFFRPAIYGDKVVWCKLRKLDGQIMLYDEGNVKVVEGAYGIFPRISSSGIMYSDIFNDHLYIYNWNEIIDLGSIDVEYTQYPHNQQISREKIVWRKYINGYHEVFLYDSSAGVTKQLTSGEVNPDSWMLLPSVRGDYVAWISKKDQLCYLRLFDGKEVSTIATAGLIDNPFFGDGFMVWAAGTQSGEDMEIFAYNLSSKEITQITDDDREDRYPAASQQSIAWQKFDGHDWEIYLAERAGE